MKWTTIIILLIPVACLIILFLGTLIRMCKRELKMIDEMVKKAEGKK